MAVLSCLLLGIEPLHSEHPLVPIRRTFDVRDVDDQVIKGFDLHVRFSCGSAARLRPGDAALRVDPKRTEGFDHAEGSNAIGPGK